MLKRVLVALAFVAALGAGGMVLASKAEAHGGGCGYGGYGHRAFYGGPYDGYYGGYPSVVRYGPGYGYPGSYAPVGFYGGGRRHHRHHDHHHHHRDGGRISFSIGF
jgi:hypothetical protein